MTWKKWKTLEAQIEKVEQDLRDCFQSPHFTEAKSEDQENEVTFLRSHGKSTAELWWHLDLLPACYAHSGECFKEGLQPLVTVYLVVNATLFLHLCCKNSPEWYNLLQVKHILRRKAKRSLVFFSCVVLWCVCVSNPSSTIPGSKISEN